MVNTKPEETAVSRPPSMAKGPLGFNFHWAALPEVAQSPAPYLPSPYDRDAIH